MKKYFQYPVCIRAEAAIAGFLCIVLSGCGSGGVSTVAVHGRVTLHDAPLSGGIITFQPVKVAAGLPNHHAQGAINADGTYSLSSFRPDDGAVPGDYVITIRAAPGLAPVDEYSKAAATAATGSQIPAIYSDAEKTPLKVTIPAAGSAAQKIDFDLKEK